MEPPVEEFGFKFHMNDVNATVGEANLRHAPRLLAACRANAEFYQRSLAGLPHVTLLRDLPVGAVSAYWLFTLRVPQGLRASLISHLREARSAEIRRDPPRSAEIRPRRSRPHLGYLSAISRRSPGYLSAISPQVRAQR